MKRIFFSLLSLLVVALTIFQHSGCANIIPPQGGPRDSLPPVLVESTPPDSTTNFRGNRIDLDFDEFVDLREVPQNVIWSPTFETPPAISVRLRTVTIKFDREMPDPNTTYTIQFGNALRDFNEGNILPNFTYTFSTGPVIDSLQLAGRVVMAETGKVDSTLIVGLHTNLEDSAVLNDRPRFIAKLDSLGRFRFHTLPRGRFAIYAFSGTGGRRYNASQPFAFADVPVDLPAADSITLFAYVSQKTTGNVTAAARPNPADRRIRFSTNQTGNRQELVNDLQISFERPLRFFDSTKIALTVDSLFRPVTGYTTTLDTSRTVLTLSHAWLPDTLYNLVLEQDFAEDTLGRRLLKRDTLSFRTKATNQYGSLTLRLRNVTGPNAVLQFVQNDKVVFSAPVSTGNFTAERFVPGDYELRILYDRNNNGIWDPGRFFGEKIQPEMVRQVGRRISVKPALENSFDISL